jgi:hypothetical protein
MSALPTAKKAISFLLSDQNVSLRCFCPEDYASIYNQLIMGDRLFINNYNVRLNEPSFKWTNSSHPLSIIMTDSTNIYTAPRQLSSVHLPWHWLFIPLQSLIKGFIGDPIGYITKQEHTTESSAFQFVDITGCSTTLEISTPYDLPLNTPIALKSPCVNNNSISVPSLDYVQIDPPTASHHCEAVKSLISDASFTPTQPTQTSLHLLNPVNFISPHATLSVITVVPVAKRRTRNHANVKDRTRPHAKLYSS